jgi:hypothetical protein
MVLVPVMLNPTSISSFAPLVVIPAARIFLLTGPLVDILLSTGFIVLTPEISVIPPELAAGVVYDQVAVDPGSPAAAIL